MSLEGLLRKKGFCAVAGMDEAGRGPWAGPLICAAVIMPKSARLPGLTDSKLLTRRKRAILEFQIRAECDVGVGKVEAAYIDRHGLIKACNEAFRRAYLRLNTQPDCLLLDGNDHFSFSLPFRSIIRGDQKVRSIAAASIIAKEERDRLMLQIHRRFPIYRFDLHKGYGTRLHRSLLAKYGPCEIHRKRYKPVKELL